MDRFNLGTHTRTVSTTSPEAQRWFDLGLNWCYGFNREEAIRCFRKALEFDPECVMVHWGMAYAAGPFYNLAWREYGEQEANASHQAWLRSHRQGARLCGSRDADSRTSWSRPWRGASRSRTPWRQRSTIAGTTTTPPRCGASIQPSR